MTLKRWYCPEHGFLCEASSTALVLCGRNVPGKTGMKRRCNKRAVIGATAYKLSQQRAAERAPMKGDSR